MLAMAQHVLSDGKTYYVPFVGASLITILLFLLQLLIARFLPSSPTLVPTSTAALVLEHGCGWCHC